MASVAATATAAPGKGKGPALVTYVFEDTVEEVAGDGSSITVDVTGGNNAGRQHLGSQRFRVTSQTKIDVDDQERATLDQIGKGYKVVQPKAPAGASSFDARSICAQSPGGSEKTTPDS